MTKAKKTAEEAQELLNSWINKPSRVATKMNRHIMPRILKIGEISLEQLVNMTSKECEMFIRQTLRPKMEGKFKSNYIHFCVTQIASFFNFMDKPIKPDKKLNGWHTLLGEVEMAEGYHNYSTEDLQKMFYVADIRMKTILSIACSTAWEISEVENMDLEKYQKIVEYCVANNKMFYYEKDKRPKTGKPRLNILNPLAIESLYEWLKNRKVHKNSEHKTTVFGISKEKIGIELKKVVKRSGIVLMGKRGTRFHDLREWTFTNLLGKNGLTDYEAKYILGKVIPSEDATYLAGLKANIEEKYPDLYYDRLCIKPQSIHEKTTEEKIKALEDIIKEKNKIIEQQKTELDIYKKPS